MKPLLSLVTALILSACAGSPPAPDWQSQAFAALNSHNSAYLEGNTHLADLEFARAKSEIARTGRPQLMARAQLIRCAVHRASLVLEPCVDYDALAASALPAEQAYAAFISGQWQQLDPATLPAHYRSLLAAPPSDAAQRLARIDDPLGRLIAASVLLQKGMLTPAGVALAVEVASAQGWRRPLLAWLGVQLKLVQAASDTAAALTIQRRIDLVVQASQ